MDNVKSIVRKTLSLNGLRTNAEEPPSPTPNRKTALLVKPVHGNRPHVAKTRLLPEIPFLIRQNGTENSARLRTRYAFPPKSDRLVEWIDLQSMYINSLSLREIELLKSYTFLGDMLVNNFLRGTLRDLTELFSVESSVRHVAFLGYYMSDMYDALPLDLPSTNTLLFKLNGEQMVNESEFVDIVKRNFDFFINPDNITPFLSEYSKDLKRIIENAPRLLSPVTVYRGFKTEGHLRGLEYVNADFVSTSLSVVKAIDFSSLPSSFYVHQPPVEYYGGVYELTITPEIPCMYLHLKSKVQNEFEILLPPGLHFTFDSKIHYKKYPTAIEFNERRIAIIHAEVRLLKGGGRRTLKKR